MQWLLFIHMQWHLYGLWLIHSKLKWNCKEVKNMTTWSSRIEPEVRRPIKQRTLEHSNLKSPNQAANSSHLCVKDACLLCRKAFPPLIHKTLPSQLICTPLCQLQHVTYLEPSKPTAFLPWQFIPVSVYVSHKHQKDKEIPISHRQ